MSKLLSTSLFILFVRTSCLYGQAPPAGTTLLHFGEVDNGIFKGSKPKTDADFQYLQSRHIKYIVNLQFLPLLDSSERKKAKKYGIVFLVARINASPVSPTRKHVETTLVLLRDSRYHPVYFHCALGRDRTSLIAALYKMYFLGMSEEQGLQYMDQSGYKNGWIRSGLKRYLRAHPTPSPNFRRRSEEEHRPAGPSF